MPLVVEAVLVDTAVQSLVNLLAVVALLNQH
jgi:hypothetical protein